MRADHPSLTARWVAAHRARLDRTRPSTPSGDVAGERRLYRDVAGIFAVPIGHPTGMAQRTALIDNEVAGAIGRGVEQIVLLGAGYDGRALRFGGGTTRWFEVDHPSTQADKRRHLDALGLHRDEVTYSAVDLMDEDIDVGRILDEAGHDADGPSLFICEGLFTYLTLGAVASLCETLRARAPAGSVLVATQLVVPEEGRRGQMLRALVDQLLRLIGEVRLSEYFPGDVEKLTVVTGWRVTKALRSPPSWIGQGSYMLAVACVPA